MPSHTLPIPDQSHLNRVRDALWNRPFAGASVMIGSGFSRNADKPNPEVDDLPLWSDVAAEITANLYPDIEPPSIDDPLRLAQQYKSTFGRSDLHGLLGQLVRDTSFLPGTTHSRLLKLPWRDVFTTNWDTLLERANLEIAEPAYSVVEDTDQLPLVTQPRIIKLHGSFPSKFPLIFTEEDYRTYPKQYAPFVNTVQQAMMETIFCLIGFSGDDPNFLNWSGWVRDNLGEAAPKIYLAGLLKLLPHQRRTLEERGVVPIDLWHHPKAQRWPEHRQHQYATQWILHSLEYGEPYDEKIWPSIPDDRKLDIDERLTPIVRVPFQIPKVQPHTRNLGASSPQSEDNQLEMIREVLRAWKHNRELYPGWLVFPSGDEHSQLSRYTSEWEPHILKALPDFTPTERINAVCELVWRREILLEPITPELGKAAQAVLDTFDCENRTIRGNGDNTVDWPGVREAWRRISVALVTDARYESDGSLFERRLEALEPFSDDSPDVAHQIQYERCLWALYSSAFQHLNELLDQWQLDNSDPMWMLRKASLLTEMNRHKESSPLVQEALNTIQKDFAEDKKIANASRLGWALASNLTGTNRRSVDRRWDELASYKCNASNDIDHITRKLQGTDERTDAPSFELGVSYTSAFSWSNEAHTRLVAAYRALRLPEVAGLPPVNLDSEGRGFPTGVAVGILTLAADELATYDPELAIRIVLRICRNERDKTFLRVLSRTRVASLSDDAAETLSRICMDVIKHFLPRLHAPPELRGEITSLDRLRVAIEVLSRLVLRVKPEVALDALDLGLECYGTKGAIDHRLLAGPIGNLLERSWEALPSHLRYSRAFDLLTAPIPGLDGFAPVTECADPGALVGRVDLPKDGTPEYTARYSEVVGLLLRGLRSTSPTTRGLAIVRLSPLVMSGSIGDDHAFEVANVLWRDSDPVLNNSAGSGAPFDWVFMLLPELTAGQAERSFRRKWLTPLTVSEDEPTGYAQGMLSQLGPALANQDAREQLLPLSEEESGHVAGQLLGFASSFLGKSVALGAGVDIRYMNTVIGAITIPGPIAEELFMVAEMVLGTESSQQRDPMSFFDDPIDEARTAIGFALIPGLVRAVPNRADTMVMWLGSGLVSGVAVRINSAMLATRTWALASKEPEVPDAPHGLIREVGAILASRRKDALAGALLCATLIFERGIQAHRDAIATFALHGLSFLAEEMQYVRHLQDDDVPTIRLLCVQLASQMSKSGFRDNAIVLRWMDIGKLDPFPEVRNEVLPSEEG